jgi:glutamate-ammonia-ligase adenylyltransferase
VGVSEFFSEIIASNPALISVLRETQKRSGKDYRALLRSRIDAEKSFSTELSALRSEWSRLLVEIGAQDAADELSVLESNRLQTELAVASINVAYLVARRELVRRHGSLAGGPRLTILGLGRLASGGMDYGSDLDIIMVYDSLVPSPVSSLTQDQAYAQLAELMITALSSITREGYLYRVDLRLRPDGKNGPLVASSEGFLEYVKERSAVWEWLAYVKLRAVAGDLELGKMIETHARHAIHENARDSDHLELSAETRHVRDRLEKEKGKRGRHQGLDIKFAAGGMLDVYFAARYLQLRDDVRDEGDDRSTQSTLERLEKIGSLEAEEYNALADGYGLLRSVDHHMRLMVGRAARLPAADHSALGDIAARLDFPSSASLDEALKDQMGRIREAYERVIRQEQTAD